MLSVVLPTYNEAASITPLIDHLGGVLQNVPHEIIVVDDDSPDGTWKVAEALGQKHPSVRVLRRIGRRGLSSAVTEGLDMAQGDILAVMDADGQHDAELLLKLIQAVKNGAGIAVGSRYVPGGSVGEWVRDRRIVSKLGTMVANRVSTVPVSDPLSGFFMMKARLYEEIREKLRPSGFKILLEILANVPKGTVVTEVPLIFRMRLTGHSKLSWKIHLQFLFQVMRLALRRILLGTSMFYLVLFWCVTAVATVVLIPKVYDLRLLAVREKRSETEAALRAVADRKGWLLSDIDLQRIDQNALLIVHREHLRVPQTASVCRIDLPSFNLSCE